MLPWSLVGIDGLANLVLACARCNGDKSGALPAVTIVVTGCCRTAVRPGGDRRRAGMADAAGPRRGRPAVSIVGSPPGVPMWSGYKQTQRLDISFTPWWS